MCGIYGYIDQSLSPSQAVPPAFKDRIYSLVHRGPDDYGMWIGSGVAMGMRRLSIIDLIGGSQPIWNEEHNLCIVYNGELYNFLDLRPKLKEKGHAFASQSDTEVILHAYEEWGSDCLQQFNGMFAFAIWDVRQQSLFIARDRIGEKPLYYFQDNDRLVFASEIKSILAHPSIPRALNLQGLSNFLAFGHAIAPQTIYQNINKLLPGHYLFAQNGQIQITKYWTVGDEPQLSNNAELNEDQLAGTILNLLDDSVRRRMVADVPLGAYLSGGVDSSAIVALMKRHTSAPIKTFSLGFPIGGAYNELSDARQVAEYLDTEHYELQVDSVDLVQTLRKLVYHYDEPFGDAAGFPVYLLSQFARQHVKVVLSGDGADELFGGYRRYAADQFSSYYRLLPSGFSERLLPALIDHLPRARRMKRTARTLPIRDPAYRYASWLCLFTPEMQAELLKSEIVASIGDHDPAWPYPLHYDGLNGSTENDHLNRMMYVDLKTWLVDGYMEKMDKATMATSLEARLPFLDHRLVELAFQIPGKYKIKGWSTKRILKRAVEQLVPSAVLRKPKHGFAVPTDPWFRDDLKEYTFEMLLGDKARSRGYFNTAFIEQLWREHVDGQNVWDTHLWLLLNFELWHRIYLDGEAV